MGSQLTEAFAPGGVICCYAHMLLCSYALGVICSFAHMLLCTYAPMLLVLCSHAPMLLCSYDPSQSHTEAEALGAEEEVRTPHTVQPYLAHKRPPLPRNLQ